MFDQATGRGVKVAVIDSGVNARHPHITKVAGGVSIVDGVEDYLDLMGHGTAVFAAIEEKAPEAEIYAVKVFHQSLRTSIGMLEDAMRWAIEQRMDLINLSLGTRNAEHIARFEPLVAAAIAQGTLLISAMDAQGETCYPGSLEGVVGVGVDVECPRELIRLDGDVFRASPYPRPLPGLPVERNLSGISFAVANVTGLVARAREAYGAPLTREALRGLIL